jgi:hypothetical protein
MKRHGNHGERFGIRYIVGDVVGCFLDADRNCISKRRSVFEKSDICSSESCTKSSRANFFLLPMNVFLISSRCKFDRRRRFPEAAQNHSASNGDRVTLSACSWILSITQSVGVFVLCENGIFLTIILIHFLPWQVSRSTESFLWTRSVEKRVSLMFTVKIRALFQRARWALDRKLA